MSSSVWTGLCNTRPPNTEESGLRSLVDWVSVSFNLQADIDDLYCYLGLENLDFDFYDWGRHTYKSHYRFSNIVIQIRNEYEYQLLLTGQGCREFENYSTINWIQLFDFMKQNNGNFTRLDIAIDDFNNRYNVNMIIKAFKEDRLISRIRTIEINKKYNNDYSNMIMNSLYLGSMSSRLSINIYDKKLERESENKISTVKTWTRTELRLKREYSNQLVDVILLGHYDLGKLIKSILKKHMKIIQRNNRKNKSRVPEIKWWSDFLKSVEGLQLSLEAPDKTIEKSKAWIKKSVSATLATIKEADPLNFNYFIKDVLEIGDEKLNTKHYEMINQYKIQQKKELTKKLASSIKK